MSSRFFKRLGVVLVAALLALQVGRGSDVYSADVKEAVRVSGAVTRPSEWTTDQLKERFATQMKAVPYTGRDGPHTSNCVPLIAVLDDAGAPALKPDPSAPSNTKNFPLRLVVVVRGRDGYTASFSLAELMTDFGNRPAWLAVDVDGKPLPDTESPARLMIPADGKAGRWVRGVATITVIDPTPATQPAVKAP